MTHVLARSTLRQHLFQPCDDDFGLSAIARHRESPAATKAAPSKTAGTDFPRSSSATTDAFRTKLKIREIKKSVLIGRDLLCHITAT